MRDIPLHDIKPLVEVPDNSLTVLISIASVILAIIVVALLVWLWKSYSKNKEENLKKFYLKKLHTVDTTKAKEAAYEISEYGKHLAVSDRAIELLASLDKRLSSYKYKKEVEKIDDETLAHFRVFLEVIDAD